MSQKRPLSDTHPELAQEALFDASTVTAGSSKRLPWRCARGHEWTTAVKYRTNGNGCPVCANKLIVAGVNDLATTHPDVAAEAQFDASKVVAGSNMKLPWECVHGHRWEAVVSSRTRGVGCPGCAGRHLPGQNDLATTHPDLAGEALFDPATVGAGNREPLAWRCVKGHEWLAPPARRVRTGQGCPTCANKRIVVGENDLATTHPHLVADALFDPTTVVAGSSKVVPWRCSKGHEWQAPVAGRAGARAEGCPTCANRTVMPGENDLASTHPELAAEALFDATTVVAGSHRIVQWRCREGHEWRAQIKSRALNHRGCPVCTNKTVIPGVNDLATTHPELAAEALFDPTVVTAGFQGKNLPWKCALGHTYRTTPSRRTSDRRAGCQYCSGRAVLPGFNDLATTHPELAAEALFDPTNVTRGSHRRLRWRCGQGHEWTATPKSRTNGTGCPTCAKTGYDPAEPAWLYLAIHESWEMTQIGITNHPETRADSHRRRGWSLVDFRGPMEGYAAAELEQAILRMLKARRILTAASSSNSRPPRRTESSSTASGEAWWTEDWAPSTVWEVLKELWDFEHSET